MFKRIFTRSTRFMFTQQRSILSAAAVIMTTVMLSRVLGLFRDRLLATYFSVDELGVYFAAFRLPNFLFELLIMGALSTAFIPVFTRIVLKENQEKAFAMGAQMINLGTISIGFLIVPLFIFARPISYLLVPGFNPEERELMIAFTRIMLVGQLIPLVIGNFMTGMLQSLQRFFIPALAPVVYNIGIIIGVVLFARTYGLYGAVFGVVIGAVLYLLVQIPLLVKLGYSHQLKIHLFDPNIKSVMRLMLPRAFGLAVYQIDTTMDLILASNLGTRSITIFNFAQQLQQLPIGLFAGTIAQAALPALSHNTDKEDLTEFKKLIIASIHQILFFVLPASAMLIVLRTPIVRLVFGAARFDWSATVATGQTLSFFAISIFAQSLVQLLARAFYALYDTKTPVIIGVVSVLINTFLSIIFVSFLVLPVWSMAISTSVASLINAAFLLLYLDRRVGGFDVKLLSIPTIKMLFASLATGVFLYLPVKLFDQLIFDTRRVFDLFLLTSVASTIGLSVYIFLAWFLDIDEVTTFFKLLQKMKRAPRLLFARSDELVTEERSPLP